MTRDEAQTLLANSTRGSIGEFHDAQISVVEAGHSDLVTIGELAWIERVRRLQDLVHLLQWGSCDGCAAGEDHKHNFCPLCGGERPREYGQEGRDPASIGHKPGCVAASC